MKKILIFSLVMSCSVQSADLEKGKAKAEQVCKTCHGMDGIGIDSSYPKLTGQFADYMEKALKDYRSGDRNNAIMAGFAATLSDEDIENVAYYYSTLKEQRLTDLIVK